MKQRIKVTYATLRNDNPFGGWKGSGATGKSSGGHYYVQQFMREQSQTIVE